MRFNLALVSSFLLASAALADLHGHHRRSEAHKLLGRGVASNSNDGDSLVAGAVIAELPHRLTTSSVQFTVPRLHSSGAVYIGLVMDVSDGVCNGDASLSALLQVVGNDHGISGQVIFQFSNETAGPSGFPVDAGDVLQFNLNAKSATSVVVSADNVTKGKRVQQDLHSTTGLCQGSMVWGLLIENSLPKFDAVTLTHGVADGQDGHFTPLDAISIEIAQGGRNLTHTTINADGSITIRPV